MQDKTSVRTAWSSTLDAGTALPLWGKAAEKLRILQPYRDADTIFAAPGNSLQQVRVNCLVDGKNLIIPSPSLREGFFFLAAHSVPFRDMATAVTYRGLARQGRLLIDRELSACSVGLLLTGSVAVDHAGGRIGDGKGYFDLCCGLLQELDALREDPAFLTFVLEEQISRDPLPQDPWDIKMSGAITPASVHIFQPPRQKPTIFWDQLSRDRIKRIDPLWKLYNRMSKD